MQGLPTLTLRRLARKCTCHSAEQRPRGTGIVRAASARSISIRSGSRCTSIIPTSCRRRRLIGESRECFRRARLQRATNVSEWGFSRIRNEEDYAIHVEYIRRNPIGRGLVAAALDYLYCSDCPAREKPQAKATRVM